MSYVTVNHSTHQIGKNRLLDESGAIFKGFIIKFFVIVY